MQESAKHGMYWRLLAMTVLSFLAMYVLMYAMVDVFANVYPNVNQIYMAGLMTAPMVAIEVVLMGAMYPNQRWNAVILAATAILLVVFWQGIRQQFLVTDIQFIKSMVPHHAGAILMCGESALRDADLRKLCNDIIAGQQSEIDTMKAKLAELEGR